MASSTERIRVKLPGNFDPNRHMAQLMKKIADAHGEGFEVDSIEDGVAVATRQVAITEVSHNDKSKTKEVRLPRSVKSTDGEKVAVKLTDQHGDGWEMTGPGPHVEERCGWSRGPSAASCRGSRRPAQ